MANKKKVIETFEIQDDVKLVGGMRSDNEFLNQIAASMKLLKVGGGPFFVPVDRANAGKVINTVHAQVKALNKGKKGKEVQAYTTRTIKDDSKKVIGTRVFRIA